MQGCELIYEPQEHELKILIGRVAQRRILYRVPKRVELLLLVRSRRDLRGVKSRGYEFFILIERLRQFIYAPL